MSVRGRRIHWLIQPRLCFLMLPGQGRQRNGRQMFLSSHLAWAEQANPGPEMKHGSPEPGMGLEGLLSLPKEKHVDEGARKEA